MADIRLIAAVGRSGQLGLGGRLPWRDPEDLRWFRHQTMGGVVIAGWRTWGTLPTLDGRKVILDSDAPCEVIVRLLNDHSGRTIWIAGGAKTYTRWLASGLVRRAVITLVDYDGPADAWMPPLWPPAPTDT